MVYEGDIAEIEALGFRTISIGEFGRATGSVMLSDIEGIAAHPNVIRLLVGQSPKRLLDVSVPNINANQVWHYSNRAFTGNTGAGVIVGIIDSGIDFQHPCFFKTTGPDTTRIKRIWDMGLSPKPGTSEESPDPNLLERGPAGNTYGVEYKDNVINDVLQGRLQATSIRHRDCSGHGTHVASIAAGNGRDMFELIGVAPEAEIVVVKYLDLEEEPSTADGFVPDIQQFKDAIMYILNTARAMGPPVPAVVINYSLGHDMGPHDGFTEREEFLRHEFLDKRGQAFVAAAGNEAHPDFPQHVRIEFPPGGGTCDLSFLLWGGQTKNSSRDTCIEKIISSPVEIVFYYPSGGGTFSAALQRLDLPLTGDPDFEPGPPLGSVAPVSVAFGSHEVVLTHDTQSSVLFDSRGTVNRDRLVVSFEPLNDLHREGTYVVRASSDATLTVHAWMEQNGPGFFLIHHNVNFVIPEDRFLINSPAGAEGVIAVASYDAAAPNQTIAESSSRGPLARYGVCPPQPSKPELAAPGVGIKAANSKDGDIPFSDRWTLNGTSMAAPHVAGAIALLFQKDPTLNTEQILDLFRATAHPPVPPETAEDVGAGRLDVLAAFDRVP